jgi:hypothetical protein
MPLDSRLIMSPEFQQTHSFFGLDWRGKYLSFAVFTMPISLVYPKFSFVMVSFSSPFHQLHVQMTITSMKDFLGADDFVVVAPPLNHRVQFPNDGLLWG